MANKDLIKRALSVTTNLAKNEQRTSPEEVAQSTGATSSETRDTPDPTPHSQPPALSQQALQPATRTGPRTGPGSMMAFMTDQSEVHKEVLELRQKVSALAEADFAKHLDPRLVVASKWANRDDSHFETDSFKSLKAEISNAGGNVQPIKVRPIAGATKDAPQWEIVFGHRRHRACLELGMPVFALIHEGLKDAQLFVEMERENREREDLSAWEQGLMYMRALEQSLFPSAKQLAAAIDRDLGNIGKAMALAKLPSDVILAFGSPLNLQFRWATALKDAHQRDPEQLLGLSREIAARNPRPAPAEVFALLTGHVNRSARAKAGALEWKDGAGVRIAAMNVDRKGRVTVSFDRPLEEAQRQKLSKALDSILGAKGV